MILLGVMIMTLCSTVYGVGRCSVEDGHCLAKPELPRLGTSLLQTSQRFMQVDVLLEDEGAENGDGFEYLLNATQASDLVEQGGAQDANGSHDDAMDLMELYLKATPGTTPEPEPSDNAYEDPITTRWCSSGVVLKNICDGTLENCVDSGKRWCDSNPSCHGIMYHPGWWSKQMEGIMWCKSTTMSQKHDWITYLKATPGTTTTPEPEPEPMLGNFIAPPVPTGKNCTHNKDCRHSIWCAYDKQQDKWCLDMKDRLNVCPWPYCTIPGEDPPLPIPVPGKKPTEFESGTSLHDIMKCSSSELLTTESMTESEYDEVVDSVADMHNSLSANCTAKYCPRSDFAGCVLRVAGHDFMDFKNGEGGSDGCTDIGHPDNQGLADCLLGGEHGASLQAAYAKFCTTVSLADFLVIAAEAVMTETRKDAGSHDLNFKLHFRYGRTTAKICRGSGDLLPNPEEGCPASKRVFLDHHKLDWSETAALMGVHTLGRARLENSGYDGFWSDPENSHRFNNNYYASLILKGWLPDRAINGKRDKNQWTRSDNGRDPRPEAKEMMLDTDMCLFYGLTPHRAVWRTPPQDWRDFRASEVQCCAWTVPDKHLEVARAHRGHGLPHCSDDSSAFPEGWHSGSFPGMDVQERGRCCGPITEPFGYGNKDNIWSWKNESFKTGGHDCAPVGQATGVAKKAVECFAQDEQKWITHFESAWYKVTGNGFAGLKCLRGSNCAPLPPLSCS